MQELTVEVGKVLLSDFMTSTNANEGMVEFESPMPGLTDEPVIVRRNVKLTANRSVFIGYWFGLKFVEFEVLLIDGHYHYTVLP